MSLNELKCAKISGIPFYVMGGSLSHHPRPLRIRSNASPLDWGMILKNDGVGKEMVVDLIYCNP